MDKMRMLASAVALAALMGASSAAYAATTTGEITGMNLGQHSITLNEGAPIKAPATAQLKRLRLGERVVVAYNGQNGGQHATSIKPAPGANASLGG